MGNPGNWSTLHVTNFLTDSLSSKSMANVSIYVTRHDVMVEAMAKGVHRLSTCLTFSGVTNSQSEAMKMPVLERVRPRITRSCSIVGRPNVVWR